MEEKLTDFRTQNVGNIYISLSLSFSLGSSIYIYKYILYLHRLCIFVCTYLSIFIYVSMCMYVSLALSQDLSPLLSMLVQERAAD